VTTFRPAVMGRTRGVRQSAVLVVGLVVLALSGCTTHVDGSAMREPNRAVIDAVGTKAVLDAVREAAEAVFVYDLPVAPGARDAVTVRYLTGDAANEVDNIAMRPVASYTPSPSKLTLTVLDAAVSDLTDTHAIVLIAGVQHGFYATGGGGSIGTVLWVSAVRQAETWRISSIEESPHIIPRPPSVTLQGSAAERDSAITAARQLGTQLGQHDGNDLDGTFARWLAASVDPLTSRLRADRARLLTDGPGGGQKVASDPLCAAITVDTGKVTVLLELETTITDSDSSSVPLALPYRMTVVRDSGGVWKAADFQPIEFF
jgi:Mce-associated membrane protein